MVPHWLAPFHRLTSMLVIGAVSGLTWSAGSHPRPAQPPGVKASLDLEYARPGGKPQQVLTGASVRDFES